MKQRHVATIGILCAVLTLSACNRDGAAPVVDGEELSGEIAGDVSSSSFDAQTSRETKNVSYEGVVQPAGISIFMEGTHRLMLDDGRFILLESASSDLNGYVDERVQVIGATRPTVESDGIIMRVEQILWRQSSSSSVQSVSSSSSNLLSSSFALASSFSSAAVVAVSSASSVSQVLSSAKAAQERTPEFEARIAAMAQQDLSQSQWTQKYCTSHIGFCVPVHRNWWYTSFGATTSQYWHLEVSSETIVNLWDGPIQVNLVSDDLSVIERNDGDVVIEDGEAVGYRTWTGDRHFELRGDASLEAAIKHMTASLQEYNPEQ